MRSAARRLCVHLGDDDGALIALLDSLSGQQQSETLRRVLVVGFCVERIAPSAPEKEVSNADRGWRVRFYGRDPLDHQLVTLIDATRRGDRMPLLAHFARRGYDALYEAWPALPPIERPPFTSAEAGEKDPRIPASGAHSIDIGINRELEANKSRNTSTMETQPLQDTQNQSPKKSAMIGLMG